MQQTLNEDIYRLRDLMRLDEDEEKLSKYQARLAQVPQETRDKVQAAHDKAGRDAKLDATIRKNINKDLHILMKPTYFESIPLGDIFSVLEKHGVVALQEDGTPWDGFLTGAEGRAYLEMGYKSSEFTMDNDVVAYIPFDNATLTLTWYKMSSGKYEVLAFIG